MPTPHIQAEKGEIAKIVLMPGDPLRAEFIAKNYLQNPKLINQVRNILGFTGTYKDKEITVMASGMGMPSIGIYSYELYSKYDVESIIRIGSAGSYSRDLKLYDIVLAESAWSESSFAKTQNGFQGDTLYPDPELNSQIMKAANQLQIPLHLAKIHSSDVFYTEPNTDTFQDIYRKHQCVCVEMESFALFHNASVLKKKAACLLTISDSFTTSQTISAEERQKSFGAMMQVALEACLQK
ncbi:MAG: purine-nucleoside phosphorylase [Lachnospiraceae bacterium]|nr:purine-nucleoside phosphorylase [Lachnospiraceae bacterium]